MTQHSPRDCKAQIPFKETLVGIQITASLMVPGLEKPRITEIQVRIDCNGCVQKIKKALHGVNGICDLYIDVRQQKLTVVGWADPEKIIEAIKKTRKVAIICAHTELAESEPAAPLPEAEGDAPADPAETQTSLPGEPAPLAEPAKDPVPPPQPENSPKESTQPQPQLPPEAADTSTAKATAAGPSEPKDVEEIHVIHHHPHQDGRHWGKYSNSYGFLHEFPHYTTTHSYDHYRPSPHISGSMREFGYSPQNVRYSTRTEHSTDDYHCRGGSSDGNNITSIFSDENPNACRIV